jgi:hypothetical protein
MIGAVGGCNSSGPTAGARLQTLSANATVPGLDADGDGDGGADDAKATAQPSASLPPLQVANTSASDALMALLQSESGQSVLQQVVAQVLASYQGSGGGNAASPSLNVVG